MRVKGLAARVRRRIKEKNINQGVASYVNTLSWLCENSAGDKSYRQGEQQLNFNLREGEVYFLRCPDNFDYYRTIMLKKAGIDGILKPLISNQIYGDPPIQMIEVSPEQVYRHMRMHNMSNLNSSLKAFPDMPLEKNMEWGK